MTDEPIRTLSGKAVSDLTLDGVVAEKLEADDFRISAASLIRQAETAERAGYPQLARNLRRAAELTRLQAGEIFSIYETLRPGRADRAELMELADHLESHWKAPLNAALVREAADAYHSHGLLRRERS